MIVPRAIERRSLWMVVAAIIVVVIIGRLIGMVHDPSMMASACFAVLMTTLLVWLLMVQRPPTIPTQQRVARATGCVPPEPRGTGPARISTVLRC